MRNISVRSARWALLATVAGVALVAGLLPLSPPATEDAAAAAPCPPGFTLVDLAEMRAERILGTEDGEGATRKTPEQMLQPMCLNNKHPEMFAELATMQRERLSAAAAPFAQVPEGAYRAALADRNALAQAAPTVEGAGGTWEEYGQGPLISNDPRFDSVNDLGLVELNGRVDSLAYDEANERLFALVGTGGLWMSENLGENWTSIGETLPTQVNGAVGFSPAGGPNGTLIVASGEPLMGGNTYTGLGGFWSNDLGATWNQAQGLPDMAMGFQVEVDPVNPQIVYAGTSMGLFRSTDLGRTFTNVNLPVSEDCQGVTGYGKCQFANFVTDVVVRVPGGVGEEAVPAGTVVAAVGYRAGMAQFPDGTVHSPGNGIYRSETGAPGSFENLDVSGTGGAGSCAPGSGFAAQQNIGRTELGIAVGPQQDHDYLYAEVEDAELFNGGVPTIDAPGDPSGDDEALYNTSFNGIYVSDDFGASWTCMANTEEVAENPATGSGLAVVGQALLFAPGVQAWYNEHIEVDPTRATEDGVPTRITFGLEELWQNRATNSPQDGSVQDPRGDFVVKGPYFADETCLLLSTGVPACPSGDDLSSDETTTHPDHQSGLWIPDGEGGVAYVAGHDGGVNVQRLGEGEELDDAGWGEGANEGFNTLLPYHARIANDGTVWWGLQDNGSGKIDGETRQRLMTFGGDGFFVAVDKENSDYAWSETPFASMRYTTDGGRDWTGCAPEITNTMFSNPFVMDPTDSNHLLTAGRQVAETVDGPETCFNVFGENVENRWENVYDLGTRNNPGQPRAETDFSVQYSMSAVEVQGDAAYVGYCGVCDILNRTNAGPEGETAFQNGFATNVGGEEAPERGTSKGWHTIVRPEGLPNRYITSIAAEPANPETVYVTLGGYANREWVPPGSYLDDNDQLGEGHVFKSTDAGQTFTNVSGNLPNVHATWVVQRPDTGQLVVGTEMGVFISSDSNGTEWNVLGDGLPMSPVSSLQIKPDDPDTLIAATFGRGVYSYQFSSADPDGEPTPVPTPTTTPPPPVDEVNRLAGDGRVGTAIAVSQAAFDSADSVVLARADLFPDALAASTLAAELEAPVLLTPTDSLDARVADEIERLGASEAYLMGGVEALSEQVESDLEAEGISDHPRVGGAGRFDTAALIADEVVEIGGPVEQAIVALGARPDGRDPWPDALASGNLAATGRAPILLANPDELPEQSSAALDRILGENAPVFIAGGIEAVGPEPEQELEADGYATQRLAGADRYATAVAIVEEAVRQGADRQPTVLANGTVFADALVAAPAAHQLGGVMVLVAPDDVDDSPATRDYLDANAEEIDTAFIVGGVEAISQLVFDDVQSLIADG